METKSVPNRRTTLSEEGDGNIDLQSDCSSSMTIISKSSGGQPRMAQLETLEAKMASIEVSLSSARRRKGTSLGGNISTRSSPRPDSRELRTALQDREAVIQNLRVQLGLNKLPRHSGTALDENELPAAEQRLARLKIDTENKKIAIRNLKTALDKLDITDNIDVRIRQAELEYALGREELQLLSLVEESRALQGRLDKTKSELNTIYSIIQSGVNLSIHAIQSTVGRWATNSKTGPGLWVEWSLEGEGLCRGDRIIEVNGKLVMSRTREELQRLLGNNGKCQLVVLRKNATVNNQQLIQTQEDNLRLQHRISYLEEQVKELQFIKDSTPPVNGNIASHITSISISSPPVTPPEKPQLFQRGNYVTTIVDGKPVDNQMYNVKNHITKTIIKENGHSKSDMYNQQMNNVNNSISASRISINNELAHLQQKRDRDRREHDLRKEERERALYNNYNKTSRVSEVSHHYHGHNHTNHTRSVEHLNNNNHNTNNGRRELIITRRPGTDLRSVKSLDFESDGGDLNSDYTSETSNGPRTNTRPKNPPPKKPLRLSLQRAQSLQTVEAAFIESENKRGLKRTYKNLNKTQENMQYIENNILLQTASLGRNKQV